MANNTTYSKVTPFVRPIAQQGGTFYTFSSAGEDFTLSFNENSARNFRFSKFALLNIPELSDNSDRKEENLVRLTGIPGADKRILERGPAAVNMNTYFAESFQNYCLNLETSLLSRDTYDASEPASVAERTFFKWLKEMGAMRYSISNNSAPVFTEEINSKNYNRVVQYLGDIDITNNFSGLVNSYNEVFAFIPTEAGNFPQVYFDTVSDNNYFPGMTLCRFDANEINNGYIMGRHYNDFHPIANFDTHAYYDNPFGLSRGNDVVPNSFEMMKSKPGVINPIKASDYENGTWWFLDTTNKYCYLTQSTRFDDATNEYLALGDPSTIGIDGGLEAWTVFKRTKLDGIQINFDYLTYSGIDDNITSLMDVATSRASQSFDFNCVLFYYDLTTKIPITPDNVDSEFPLPTNFTQEDLLATNLFGVLFLDKVNTSVGTTANNSQIITSLGGARIPSLTKCIPNSVTKLNGDSYGIKLNIKLDVSNANSGVEVETYISDSKTFSLDVFAGALNSMHKTSDLIVDYFFDGIVINDRITALEETSNSNTAASYNALKERVNQLERYMTQNEIFLQIAEKKDLVDLINQNYTILNNLLLNNTSLKVLFDLSGLKQGPGVIITPDGNGVTIESSEVDFNFGDRWKIYPPDTLDHPFEVWAQRNRNDIGNSFYYEYETDLKPLKNYIRLVNDGAFFVPKGDFYLKIKDGFHTWRTGQSMRIYFADAYPMILGSQNFDFYIVTDFNNILNKSSNYSARMAKITAADFRDRGNKPVFEIHCVDAASLTFITDFLN